MEYHLAHVNIARMKAAPGEEAVEGLVARIEEMNRLAESSLGFVWRLPGAEAAPEALQVFDGYLNPFEPERIFYNLSVWETVEDLRNYVYHTRHADMVRDRRAWIEPMPRAPLALWWIPRGELPTIAASALRLRAVDTFGASPMAFTLEQLFPAPDSPTSFGRPVLTSEARVALFRQGRAAFSGKSYPVGKGEDKVVRLLLSSAAGCDVTITAEQFQVRHGNDLRPTDYFPETIPGLLTQLLAWSGVPLPATEVRAVLDPAATAHGLPKWLATPRFLWMAADPEHIRIAVRDGSGKSPEELVSWPEPFPPFVPRYVDLTEPLACPYCGNTAKRYRQLVDQSFVCPACGRSFQTA